MWAWISAGESKLGKSILGVNAQLFVYFFPFSHLLSFQVFFFLKFIKTKEAKTVTEETGGEKHLS